MRCYEFHYPGSYTMEERLGYQETATGETLLRGSHSTIITQVEDQYRESVRSSFEEFAIERAKAMCQADGPDSSVYAGAVLEKKAPRISGGLEVLQFSLSIIRETYGDDGEKTITKETGKGPFFVVSISRPADELHQALFFQFEPDDKDLQEKKELTKQIIETVRILR
jgi:hypothetical protein